MFKNASIMVMLEDNNMLEVCKLETDRNTQISICKSFSEAYRKYITGKEKIKFDGKYKPENDEILCISDFILSEDVVSAIKEPAGVKTFIPDEENKECIRAIFVGEEKENKVKIAFQKFKKEQYITMKGINLFFDRETFKEEKRFGISISDCVDCIYDDGDLQFESYYMARQIFDLREHYRIATDEEVESFIKINSINFEDEDIFKKQSDSIVRKKIASIMDSKVFENYSANDIKKIGKSTGVEIKVKDKKIVIPEDKKKMKILLGFLDEEVYKGVFSKDTFITNSKRVVT